MKIVFFIICGVFLFGTISFADTSSNVIDFQTQGQSMYSIPLPNGGSLDVGIQFQHQEGYGESLNGSFAGDFMYQGERQMGSTLTSFAGGIARDGNYHHINNQGGITIKANIDNDHSMNGAVGGMGAMTFSKGNAFSYAGGYMNNGDWSMSNFANSYNKPVSINVDGFVEKIND